MHKHSSNTDDEALLFAVTPAGRCIGIRIFPQQIAKIRGKKELVDNYIEERLKNAINIRNKIERDGVIGTECSEIVTDLAASHSRIVEQIIRSHRQWMREEDLLKVEKYLIDLNAALEYAMQPNKYNFRICSVILGEINDLYLRNKVTPLMLKKHLTVVENIAKLTHFSKPDVIVAQRIVYSCSSSSIIRNIASTTMKRLKMVMNFIGNDKQFLHRLRQWSELLHQLTKHMTDEEIGNLVIDPALPSPLPNA